MCLITLLLTTSTNYSMASALTTCRQGLAIFKEALNVLAAYELYK